MNFSINMKRIIIFFGILFLTLNAYAQNINFTATAPSAVANQSQFRVVFTINGDAKDFRIGEIDGFNVLMGPSTSRSQNVQIIGGRTESSVSTTYTYVLQAQKEGTFTIPAATVTVDNQRYVSNTLTVKVLPADANVQQQQGSAESSSQNISGVEVFVRAIPSKTTVFEQEAILLTFKLYARGVNVAGFSNMKFPEPKGFLAQEIELANDRQFQLENYNDKNYNTLILKQTLLFPQYSGELEIGEGTFEVVLRIANQASRRGFFDDFFNSYQDVKRTITSPSFKINVKPLPAGKPKSFANAVGEFTMKSDINTTELKANEPITIKITISGTGNLRLIKNPEIVFPASFEVYDPKVDLKTKNTTSGVVGSRTIEYLAIPRYAGNFTISAAEFSFFDLKTQTYKTLKTDVFNIKVEKGEGTANEAVTNYVSQEALKFLGSDIRHIDTENLKLKQKNDFFFGSVSFMLLYLIPLSLAIVLFIVFRKQAKENANIALVRTKKANKVAAKRLKIAKKYLEEKEKGKFYDEVLKALWGYFSDKLNIPVARLTKDNIESELSKAGVDEALIADFNNILSTCEYAQYAPGSGSEEMEQLYNQTIEKIGELEVKIKK